MLNESEHTTAQVTADFLATSRYLAVFNFILLIYALYQSYFLLLHFILAAIWLYLHIRLAFDQRIFAHITQISLPDFDRTLIALGLAKNTTERDIVQRAKGAIRLWRYLAYTTVAQMLLCFI